MTFDQANVDHLARVIDHGIKQHAPASVIAHRILSTDLTRLGFTRIPAALEIYPTGMLLRIGDTYQELSETEAKILGLLVSADRSFTVDEVLKAGWAGKAPNMSHRVHIFHIRKKLGIFAPLLYNNYGCYGFTRTSSVLIHTEAT